MELMVLLRRKEKMVVMLILLIFFAFPSHLLLDYFGSKTLLTFLKMDLGNFSFVASAYSLPCGLGSLSKTSSFSPCSLWVWTWSQLKTGVFASLHQKEAVIVVFLRGGSNELDKVSFLAKNVEYVLVGRVLGEYCRCTGRPPPYQPVPNSLLLSCYTSKPLAFLDFFLNFFLVSTRTFWNFERPLLPYQPPSTTLLLLYICKIQKNGNFLLSKSLQILICSHCSCW